MMTEMGLKNYETSLSILEVQARKNGSITQQKAKQCARITGEFGGTRYAAYSSKAWTVGQRPKLLDESRRPSPPVSSLPPCFPNSKGLHQVISIPKFAVGKCDQNDSKVSTKTYIVIHCGLFGEPCNKYTAPSSLVCQSQCFRLTSAYSAALGVCVCVCAWLQDLIIRNV